MSDWGALEADTPEKDGDLSDVGVSPDSGNDNAPEYAAEVATEFGADDREQFEEPDSGQQSELFIEADENQQTLTGESADGQCNFTE